MEDFPLIHNPSYTDPPAAMFASPLRLTRLVGCLPGAYLKYAVYDTKDELLALPGFGASAWRVADRDAYIGWSDEMRKKNLHLVINNARFLILPWICFKNLAFMILSIIAKRIADDWEKYYKYKPVLLETHVEKERFTGSCYRAANWQYAGTTKGRGKKIDTIKLFYPKNDNQFGNRSF